MPLSSSLIFGEVHDLSEPLFPPSRPWWGGTFEYIHDRVEVRIKYDDAVRGPAQLLADGGFQKMLATVINETQPGNL